MGDVGRPGRPSQLPARGDRTGWNNLRNNQANNIRNWNQNNVNFNRFDNRPGGWWGGGYGHGFAHGWAASNRWNGWGSAWGWNGWRPGQWWGAATVAGLTAWGIGELFDDDDVEPVYYDYGNTTYIDNGQVYVNEQPVATEAQYAEQAIQYASVPLPEPPPVTETGAATDEAAMKEFAENWMGLGVFAVSKVDVDEPPVYYLQLAVSKDGHIAGTIYNSIQDQTLPITGSVDKKSQRAAWQRGDNPDVVMETGLFNLTQDTAPALIHFGKDKTEQRLLVRAQQEKAGGASPQTATQGK